MRFTHYYVKMKRVFYLAFMINHIENTAMNIVYRSRSNIPSNFLGFYISLRNVFI